MLIGELRAHLQGQHRALLKPVVGAYRPVASIRERLLQLADEAAYVTGSELLIDGGISLSGQSVPGR